MRVCIPMAIRMSIPRLSCTVITLALGMLLAACGGGATMSASGPAAPYTVHSSSSGDQQSSTSTSSGASPSTGSKSPSPQYLIKSLRIVIQLNNPLQGASDLEAWMFRTDPQATSAGTDYALTPNNSYTITMSFNVEATRYNQMVAYLRDYGPQHNGKLLNLHESVQDATNDYIDTQSRLQNLKAEQQRLLALIKQASALNDVLNIEQRLTDVEGEIEQIEAHLKALNNQLTLYSITIVLQPPEVATVTPPQSGWSAGQVLHDAWSASLAFGEAFLSLLLWLLAFSIYIVPAGLVAGGIAYWRQRRRRLIPPPIVHS